MHFKAGRDVDLVRLCDFEILRNILRLLASHEGIFSPFKELFPSEPFPF